MRKYSNGLADQSNRDTSSLKKSLKHGLVIIPMVVTEGILVDVVLEILGADRVVDARDTALGQAPEVLDGIGMDIAHHIHLSRV